MVNPGEVLESYLNKGIPITSVVDSVPHGTNAAIIENRTFVRVSFDKERWSNPAAFWVYGKRAYCSNLKALISSLGL